MYSPSTMSSRRATHYCWYIHYFTTKEVFSAHTEYYRLQYRWVIQTTLPSIFVHGTQVVYTQTKADKQRILIGSLVRRRRRRRTVFKLLLYKRIFLRPVGSRFSTCTPSLVILSYVVFLYFLAVGSEESPTEHCQFWHPYM